MASGEPVEAMAVNSGQFIQHILEGNDKDRDRKVKVAVGWNSQFSGSLFFQWGGKWGLQLRVEMHGHRNYFFS